MVKTFFGKFINFVFVEIRDWFFAISAFCLMALLPQFSSSLTLNLIVLITFIAVYLAAVVYSRRRPKN